MGAPFGGWIAHRGGPQARRRSRRHGLRPCVSTQSKRPAAVRLRFAGICGERVVCRRLLRGVREKTCSHLRWGKPYKRLNWYAYRRGGTFDSPKVPKSDLGLRPKNPTHRNARPESQSDDSPDRGLNGAYKVQQAHLPPPNLPRFGGGERPPILCKSIVPRTITMGRRRGFRQAAAVR